MISKAMVYLAVLIFAAAAAGAPPLQEREPPPIPWRDSYHDGLDEARRARLPLLLYFSADWCEPCRRMEATTFRDSEFLAVVTGFVPVKSMYSPESSLAKKFGVAFIPAMILVDEDGQPLAHVPWQNAERLVPFLQMAASGYADYLVGLSSSTDFSDSRRIASYLVKVGNTGRAVAVLEAARKQIPKSDVVARERADLDVAEAYEVHGDLSRAADLYGDLSMKAYAREVRARSLYRLSRVETRRGRPKKAEEAKARLEALYSDLAPALEQEKRTD